MIIFRNYARVSMENDFFRIEKSRNFDVEIFAVLRRVSADLIINPIDF